MKRLLFLIIVALLSQSGIARDFSYTSDGQTLRYSVIDEAAKTCEVAEKNKVTGELIIPSIAKDGDSEFTVTSISEDALADCGALTSVTIPNSVTSIGEYAFTLCTGLTSVTIPNSVTSIGDHAFWGCSGLTKVIIGNSVTSIGKSAFTRCSGLTSVTIPNSVTSIGRDAFWLCRGLTKVIFGKTINRIENGAFSECEKITDIICMAEKVPYLNKRYVFSDNVYVNATLHVPGGSLNDYKTTSPWSLFLNIVGDAEEAAGSY